MNAEPSSDPVPAARHSARRWIALLALVPLVVLLAGVAGCYRRGSETRQAHAALQACASGWGRERIEVGAGPWLLGAARIGLWFAPVEPEARMALRSLCEARVSVMQPCRGKAADPALLNEADQCMTRLGWQRVVGVITGSELVAVYAPANASSPDDCQLGVLVCTPDALVLVSARGDLRPLARLAWAEARKAGWHPGR